MAACGGGDTPADGSGGRGWRAHRSWPSCAPFHALLRPFPPARRAPHVLAGPPGPDATRRTVRRSAGPRRRRSPSTADCTRAWGSSGRRRRARGPQVRARGAGL
eukprot:7389468-Prymnesium_polylepis.1